MRLKELKEKINEVVGLPNVPLAAGDQASNFNQPPSYRDLAAFNFLPQHIVANPQTLFFKTDTVEHHKRLVRVFPLGLGTATSDQIVAQQEEEQVRRTLQRLQKELEQTESATDSWLNGLKGIYLRGQELGLLPMDVPIGPEQILSSLRAMVAGSYGRFRPELLPGRTGEIEKRFRELTSQEHELSRSLASARRKLVRVRNSTTSVRQLGTELASQERRLAGTGWLAEHIAEKCVCPFCGSDDSKSSNEAQRLVELSQKLMMETSAIEAVSPRLAAEEIKILNEIETIETQFRLIRKQRDELEDAAPHIESARQEIGEIYRYIGRVEQALATFDYTEDTSDLTGEIRNLETSLITIQKRVDINGRRQRTSAALERVSRTIQKYARELQLERREDAASLNIDDLSLTFINKQGHRDFLWEIGSGENWMGYHIALMLALHEQFLEEGNSRSPVFSFLLIDQPTQVYFPARDDTYDTLLLERDEIGKSNEKMAGDLSRARRIFSTLSKVIEETNGALQIIVTDHADEATWGGIPSIHLVGNWRNDEFLIPNDWASTEQSKL